MGLSGRLRIAFVVLKAATAIIQAMSGFMTEISANAAGTLKPSWSGPEGKDTYRFDSCKWIAEPQRDQL